MKRLFPSLLLTGIPINSPSTASKDPHSNKCIPPDAFALLADLLVGILKIVKHFVSHLKI